MTAAAVYLDLPERLRINGDGADPTGKSTGGTVGETSTTEDCSDDTEVFSCSCRPTNDLAVETVFAPGGRNIPGHEWREAEFPPEVAYQIIHDELMLDGNRGSTSRRS